MYPIVQKIIKELSYLMTKPTLWHVSQLKSGHPPILLTPSKPLEQIRPKYTIWMCKRALYFSISPTATSRDLVEGSKANIHLFVRYATTF